jgi:hypothetical protein
LIALFAFRCIRSKSHCFLARLFVVHSRSRPIGDSTFDQTASKEDGSFQSQDFWHNKQKET